MRAIKRNPRVAAFRIIAADRELQQGGLIAARKLLMRAVRAKTDDRLLIWQQLFKLECAAIHRIVTVPQSDDVTADTSTAIVVFKHGVKDLAEVGSALVDKFRSFAREAVDTLEMSIVGYAEPARFEELKEIVA